MGVFLDCSRIGVAMNPGWMEFTRTPLGSPVQRDVLGQGAYRALSGVVGRRHAEPAAGAEDRADVDDRAVAALLQRLGGDLHAEEDPELVDVDGALPLFDGGLLDGLDVAHPRVVDQDVE
jgi:hypothetical protein